MKFILLILLIGLVYNQQDIVRVQDQCLCENLLNQSDCEQKVGCVWKTITNTSFCSKYIQLQYDSICQSVINKITNCAQTFGCAYFNATCQSFSGCSSYYFKSTSACQSVSSRCVSDGNQCINIQNCINYQSETLCNNFPSSSEDKSCKWVENKCQDKQCKDAPLNYNSNSLCTKWKSNCITNGQGCTDVLEPCNQYKKSNGCNQYIGIDGNCMDSWNDYCRSITCQDAPQTLNSDQECSQYKNGCLTNGKGCTDKLILCSQYDKSIGCKGFIGIDGPCTNSLEIYKQYCKVLECTDAPTKLNTNKDCDLFLNGCITNGRGCVFKLVQCSKYIGTKTICQEYIGIEGYCDGIDARVLNCKRRLCEDAPSYYTISDTTCNNFQIGCVSNGVSCVQSLLPCNEYYGTSSQCQQYKGSDGNCTSNNSQASNCKVKDCAQANYLTNKQCQDYSYTCITNGQTCIKTQQCEQILDVNECQFNHSCQSAQVCVDKSDCTNFITMSLCLQNQQNYKSGNNTYKRQCKWNQNQTCTNQKCSEIQSDCQTDLQCSEILSGCLTNGSRAIDVSEPCSSYQGNTQTCLQFKGNNGTIKCSQNIDNDGDCQPITQCQDAINFFKQLTEQICQNFLTGCSFNGKDNCIIGDCTSYYGTQYTCSLINTAIYQGQQQPCWKVNDPSNQNTNCELRQCSHAVPTSLSPFNSNYLCQLFLRNCFWNGLQSGGCVTQGDCSQYQGNLQTCQQYTDGISKCTKKANFCRPIICENKIVPSSLTTLQDKASFCQQIINENGFNCQLSQANQTQCQTPIDDGVANCKGYVALEKQTKYSYCQSLNHSYKGITCIYREQSYCDVGICTYIFIGDLQDNQKAKYCQSKIDSEKNKCGIASLSQTMCSIQQCTDIMTSYDQYTCSNYAGGCRFHSLFKICYKQYDLCSNYFIPFSSELQKVIYCKDIVINFITNAKCCYQPSISINTCSLAQTCDQINIQSINLTFEEKIQFCQNQTMEGGQSCVYDQQISENKCSQKKNNCQEYQLPNVSKLQNQIFCQSLYNAASQQCAYLDGVSNCVDYQFDCSSHLTYGENFQQNFDLCNQLKSSNQSQCQYSAGLTCVQVDCTQILSPNLQICNQNNCVFDGLICFKKMNDCSGYISRDQGLGRLFNCNQLQDLNNNFCGYTEGNNCSIKACYNQIDNPNQETCASYNQCIFNGAKCQIYQNSPCTAFVCGYQPYDQNYDKNAKFCNSLFDSSGSPCTFYVQQVTCIVTQQSCTQYYVGNNPLSQTICSYLQDSNLKPCTYISGVNCSYKQCGELNLAISDQECTSFMKGCESDQSTNCSSANCSDAPSYDNDVSCQQFKKGCVTNGKGCIDQSETCQQYKGTKQNCKKFKGLNGTQYCDNYDFAVDGSQCINRYCELNTVAPSQADCNSFYPLNGGKYCVWNGSLGCKQPSKCIDFIGTADSCPTFTATDGPCYGNGSLRNPQQCLPNECLKAPKSYTTNQQCQQWHSDCITNGFGCIFDSIYPQCSQMLTINSCLEQSTSGCGIAQQCKTIQQKCSDFKTAYECNNYLLFGQSQINCAWNPSTNQCGGLICELLPVTLITDISCNSSLKGCITNGAGCMNQSYCSSYNRMSCNVAQTIEIQKKCIWKDSLCRPIQCTDNIASQSDTECNSYLTGCRTTGLGCASIIQCSDFISPKFCLQDTSGNSCLWYKYGTGSCIKFTQCSDLVAQTHNQCQTASTLCTTNGSFCVPLTKCQDFKLQISCVRGIDGICGWKQQQCQLFTKCEDSITNCQEWSLQCTQDKISGQCRLSKCEDNQFTTYSDCQQYSKNCTTNGTFCTQINQCATYKSQVSCLFGTDGQCNWIQSKQLCKINECTDWNLTSSSQCASSTGLDCVSNSTNCIPRNNCSSYTFKDACQSGGIDGLCVFASTNSSDYGTCSKFVECQQAQQNQTLCNIRSDACYFNKNATQCQIRTCNITTVADNCLPIPSFDLSQYQICIMSGLNCISGNPTQINSAALCYKSSAQTYTWNPKTQQCVQCVQSIDNNVTQNQTTSQYEYVIILGFLIYIQFL